MLFNSRRLLSLLTSAVLCGCTREKAAESGSSAAGVLEAVTVSVGSGKPEDPVADGVKFSEIVSPVMATLDKLPNAANPPDQAASPALAPATADQPATAGQQPEFTESDPVEQMLASVRQLQMAESPEGGKESPEARRDRYEKVIDLCGQILKLVTGDVSTQEEFHQAIGHLLETRLQMALNGTKADVDQLYGDVQSLNERDPGSVAAAEGIYTLARFAHLKARLETGNKTLWLENFSRWALEFSDRFPQQKSRCTALLFGAGRSCELHAFAAEDLPQIERLTAEARLCYVKLVTQFEATPECEEAAAVLRRLELPGRLLTQFAGPTTDGGYVSAESFRDSVTLIYFWDSTSTEFRNDLLPLLQQAAEVSEDRVRFVGVCLDSERSTLDTFVQQNKMPGTQIYFPDAEQNGWNCPLVRFWGVSQSATVWLVNRDGTVHAVDVRHHQLVAKTRELFRLR